MQGRRSHETVLPRPFNLKKGSQQRPEKKPLPPLPDAAEAFTKDPRKAQKCKPGPHSTSNRPQKEPHRAIGKNEITGDPGERWSEEKAGKRVLPKCGPSETGPTITQNMNTFGKMVLNLCKPNCQIGLCNTRVGRTPPKRRREKREEGREGGRRLPSRLGFSESLGPTDGCAAHPCPRFSQSDLQFELENWRPLDPEPQPKTQNQKAECHEGAQRVENWAPLPRVFQNTTS